MPPSALSELEPLLRALSGKARLSQLAQVDAASASFPVWSIELGSEDPRAPTLALVGGVHGLERIGSQVVIAYLHTLASRLSWDRWLRSLLTHARIVALPLVNPGGMFLGTRANPRGVDLMRNAPAHPSARGTFLVGGQNLTRRLPWFHGDREHALELESRALVETIERRVLCASASIALDCHSGFGLVDRLWFPYARSRQPFPHLAELVGIKRLLDSTHPNHVYRMEPQAQSYTIDGDLWDHLYDRSRELNPSGSFVPITLEMGSWLWVRKNPRQLTSIWGSFNPTAPHRLRRTLRRHLPLIDLLLAAVASPEAWLVRSDEERVARELEAYSHWKLV